MKTIMMRLTYAAAAFLIVAASVIVFRCTSEKSMDSLEILRRIPADNVLVLSLKPAEMQRSNLFKSLSLKGREMRNFYRTGREFRARTGINPIDDIERVIIMNSNLRNFETNWCVLVQGNIKGFFTDSIYAMHNVERESESIQGSNVDHLLLRTGHNSKNVYLYHDDGEIMLTAGRDKMDQMLSIKKNGGKTLDEDQAFIRKFRSLSYTRDAWGTVDVGDLMEEVLRKVHEKKPDLNLGKLDISNVQAGLYLDDKLGVSANAFCPNQAQSKLLYDAINGLLAFGKLTVGSAPEIRTILDRVEITQTDDQLTVNTSISLEDILALENLKPKR